ncbi:hypothetical protein, partial [Enterobacter cloacae]|uniref:hypothetical protein n=1 Tax=Enterobacter cloacae TaxID=550 RepID=UPI0019531720
MDLQGVTPLPTLGAYLQHLRRLQRLQQVPVVADHHQRSRPCHQQFFQRLQGTQIQRIAGLVQQQQLR